MKEQKDVRQRIEEGEFAQSAEISASYLDEDILIIDNVKVLQNPDPMRFQMNMIASCQRGSLRAASLVRSEEHTSELQSLL